jgi:hypothetical protein
MMTADELRQVNARLDRQRSTIDMLTQELGKALSANKMLKEDSFVSRELVADYANEQAGLSAKFNAMHRRAQAAEGDLARSKSYIEGKEKDWERRADYWYDRYVAMRTEAELPWYKRWFL